MLAQIVTSVQNVLIPKKKIEKFQKKINKGDKWKLLLDIKFLGIST